MDSPIKPIKRKFFFEFYPFDDSAKMIETPDISDKKVEKLWKNKVKTVFILSARTTDSYSRLLEFYKNKGFVVKNFHITQLDRDHITKIFNEIISCFKKNSTLMIYYGDTLAGAVITSFYIYSGKSVEESLNKIQKINSNLIVKEEEIPFIYDFDMSKKARPNAEIKPDQKSDKPIHPSEDIKNTTLGVDASFDKNRKDEPNREDGSADNELPDTNIEHAAFLPMPMGISPEKVNGQAKSAEIKGGTEAVKDSRFGPFYSSLRFKLISIISFIIIVAISSMIFLATYFFKSDNKIRVQESNHSITEITALKVKSEFISIIEKSRLIARAMLDNIRGNDKKQYSNIIIRNDKDFIFVGIAVKGRGGSSLKFIKSVYNTPLMKKIQISQKSVRAAHRSNRKIFFRSFNSETVIHNISYNFKNPVIGLSLPFQGSKKEGVKSVLISYIKLNRFLDAFSSAGITKIFLINGRGDIIAHTDSKIIVSGGNYINIPIIKMMIKSTLNNGQTRYRDENNIIHLGSFRKIGIAGCGVIATVEEEKAFQEVFNIQRRNIYLMIIVLSFAILIVFFFGKSITTPIIRLVNATYKIKKGEYNVDIEPAAKDEIGELTIAFIEMGKGLAEREKIKKAFGKFVNPELAELLIKDEVKLGGERKTIAILFSDIRSFTAISEDLEPEEVVDFLNEYMTIMVKCIDDTSGIVDKFIGDAIMALWGVPVSRGNDSENAINGALQMRNALIEFNKGRGSLKKPIISIGCGINTGPVLAGQIGSEDRMEYTVIGDAVNLASRIEALNKPMGTDILITEDTYNQVKDIFAVKKMKPIKVKGKEKPQQIYAVLGRLTDRKRPENIEELRKFLNIKKPPIIQGKDELDQKEVKYEILD